MSKHITSRDNPLFKQLRKLAESARERRLAGQTLLDGPHLLQAYADSGGVPQTLLLQEGEPGAEIAALCAQFSAVQQVVLPPALFAELSPVATPSGLLALIDIPQRRLPERPQFGLLLEDLQDPGNLGSVLRSAAAAGVDALWLSKGCADAWSPKTLRGGQGAHFVLPIVERADLPAVAAAFAGTTLAACLHGTPLFDLDLRGPVAFIIGNEGAGLGETLLQVAGQHYTVPMPGRVESLNAAAAAAISLFERVRQTR